jgi:hypothetical protein
VQACLWGATGGRRGYWLVVKGTSFVGLLTADHSRGANPGAAQDGDDKEERVPDRCVGVYLDNVQLFKQCITFVCRRDSQVGESGITRNRRRIHTGEMQ